MPILEKSNVKLPYYPFLSRTIEIKLQPILHLDSSRIGNPPQSLLNSPPFVMKIRFELLSILICSWPNIKAKHIYI